MVNTYWKKHSQKAYTSAAAAVFLAALPEVAFALGGAGGGGIFCWVAQYFKSIVGAAALVAIFLWAIEHIFGVSKLHDIVIKVGVACGIVIAAASLITSSGLTVGCNI
ncbi:hypothetical protein [Noviherbaspirillum malthae]|uniref:hypothetical protein n=1 Tax=Noviherbaspirillum malthae TaxID=1260987 RepID=UPI00188FF02B|nr:hypothetical protein [Noviherbaspirillum malthae]